MHIRMTAATTTTWTPTYQVGCRRDGGWGGRRIRRTSTIRAGPGVLHSAVDPHSFYADPDPAVFLNADPYPDPGPGPA